MNMNKYFFLLFQSNPELALIWAVGQAMWQRDFPAIYEALNKDWSDNVKPTMNTLLGQSYLT